MPRGTYRDEDEAPESNGSWIGTLAVLGAGIGLGWLRWGREVKRWRPPYASRGPYVADIESRIRRRGIDPRSYGLSGR